MSSIRYNGEDGKDPHLNTDGVRNSVNSRKYLVSKGSPPLPSRYRFKRSPPTGTWIVLISFGRIFTNVYFVELHLNPGSHEQYRTLTTGYCGRHDEVRHN